MRGLFVATLLLFHARPGHAELPPGPAVSGVDLTEVDVGTGPLDRPTSLEHTTWSSLADTNVRPGQRWLAFTPTGGDAVLVPTCAGRKRVLVDGAEAAAGDGPLVLDLPRDGREHRVAVLLDVSGYEHRVACGGPPRAGTRVTARGGLVPLDFASPHAAAGGGHAVVYVPPEHDDARPAALLVGLHPWNGEHLDLRGLRRAPRRGARPRRRPPLPQRSRQLALHRGRGGRGASRGRRAGAAPPRRPGARHALGRVDGGRRRRRRSASTTRTCSPAS